LQDYIIQLVKATRENTELALGASPRASFALFRASQAMAAVRGRDFVIPDDIQALVAPVLTHRLIANPDAELRGRTPKRILNDILTSVPLKLADSQA
jgi:MoxR-like ATPase